MYPIFVDESKTMVKNKINMVKRKIKKKFFFRRLAKISKRSSIHLQTNQSSTGNYPLSKVPYENPTDLTIFPIDENVSYILVSDLKASYLMQPDLCGNLSLIPFSTKFSLSTDGYVADYNEPFPISTCFGHKAFIQFVNVENKSVQIVDSTFQLGLKLTEDQLKNLRNGNFALLKLEFDHQAFVKYKLTLDYISKCANENIKQNCKQKIRIKQNNSGIMTKLTNSSLSNLYRKMNIIYSTIEIKKQDVIIVCGSQNCGKTSLIHYLINRYISSGKNKSVAYLECDPGQTEFAPCGILSLVRINKKICNGPGHKFLFKHDNYLLSDDDELILSKIFGTISPSGNSFDYIALIQQLYNKFSELNMKIPLFINTIGWIKHLGLELLARIISIVNPKHVIRIENNRLGECVNKNITSSLGIYSDFPDLCQLFEMKKQLGFQLWVSSFNFPHIFGSSNFAASYIRREINQLLYLITNLFPDIIYRPFYSLKPICLSLNELYVHFVNYPSIIPNSIFDLLNVQWVFIGSIDPSENLRYISIWKQTYNNQETSSSSNNNIDERNSNNNAQVPIKLLQELPQSAKCFGCGVIRNVDIYRTNILITVPTALSTWLNPEQNRINFLVLPNQIPIPSGLLVEQFLYQDSCSLPYSYITKAK